MQRLIWWSSVGYIILHGRLRKGAHAQRLCKTCAFKKCCGISAMAIGGQLEVRHQKGPTKAGMLCSEERKIRPEWSPQVQNIFSLFQGLFTWVAFLFYSTLTIPSPLSVYSSSYLPELPKLAPQPCTLEVRWFLELPEYLGLSHGCSEHNL